MKKIIQSIQKTTSLNEQEAWWMLEHITKKTRATLLHANAASLSPQELLTIDEWIYKLTQESMPLSYLLGSVPFLNVMIKVRPPILIPRPETEEWIANLIHELQPHAQNIKSILEIGTGSGCIALSLAKAFPNAVITAIDINSQALKLTQENAAANNIKNIILIESDLFNNIHNQTFDLIVSNPPYIDTIHKKTMVPQVIKWEDEQALFADQEGLHLLYEIIKHAKHYLNDQTHFPYQLVLEHDNGQQEQIKLFAQSHDFYCVSKKDLFGNYRTSWCKLINSDHS